MAIPLFFRVIIVALVIMAFIACIVLQIVMFHSFLDHKTKLAPLQPKYEGEELSWWQRILGPCSGRVIKEQPLLFGTPESWGHAAQGFFGMLLCFVVPLLFTGTRFDANTSVPNPDGNYSATSKRSRFLLSGTLLFFGLGIMLLQMVYIAYNYDKRTNSEHADGYYFAAGSFSNNLMDIFAGQLAGVVLGAIVFIVVFFFFFGYRKRDQVLVNSLHIAPFVIIATIIIAAYYYRAVAKLDETKDHLCNGPASSTSSSAGCPFKCDQINLCTTDITSKATDENKLRVCPC